MLFIAEGAGDVDGDVDGDYADAIIPGIGCGYKRKPHEVDEIRGPGEAHNEQNAKWRLAKGVASLLRLDLLWPRC